jgi:hypothetical protein
LLIVTLLFSLSAALLISATSRNERRAWFGAAVLIGFLATVPPLFRWVPLPSTVLLGLLSPTPGFSSLADALFDRQPQAYWFSIIGAHLLTWGFLIAACLVLPRSWQDKPIQKANREIKTAHRLRNEVERRRSMHLNPVVWMLTRGARADWYVWAVIGFFALPAIVLAIVWPSPAVLMFPFFAAALALNLLLAVWVAAKACFMIADARDSGALALLLTTPITPQLIVDGHMEALKRQFIAPFIALCCVEVLLVALLGFGRRDELALAIVATLVLAALMSSQLISAAWFGLWSGLTTKRPGHGAGKTILYLIIVPVVSSLLFSCGCLWPVITLVKDAIFINYARNHLHQQFRNIITEGAPAKLKPWSRPPRWPPKLPNVLDK